MKTKAKVKKMLCSICGDPIVPEVITGWAGGHNAQPVNDGRCCSDCNAMVVLPARLRRVFVKNAIIGDIDSDFP